MFTLNNFAELIGCMCRWNKCCYIFFNLILFGSVFCFDLIILPHLFKPVHLSLASSTELKNYSTFNPLTQTLIIVSMD